nr:hypothetical protein [Tanacetum cinerariifolium]
MEQQFIVQMNIDNYETYQILPWDFLQDIWKNTFKIYINRTMYKVRHERVQTDPNLVERPNILLLALFRSNGTCMHDGIVFPSMLMLPARTIPSYAVNDKRVEHFCSWVGHIGHYTEDDVFYTILSALVYDKHELDKYKKAVLIHDDVRYIMALKLIADCIRRGRRSDVKMTRNWRVFGTMCDFELPKMLRFKLVEKVKDVEGVNMEMPLFHVC